MHTVEKRIFVRRLPDTNPRLYRLAVDGFTPVAVKDILLGQMLGLLLGIDAAKPLEALVSGRWGEYQARVWITTAQISALEVLLSEYELM